METWDNINVVKYNIFCNDDEHDASHLLLKCKSFCSSLLGEYIWQKESFELSPIDHQSGLPCLCGSTDFGDNVNDEWFIVFLLFELSKHFQGIVIQVSDNDGDFLLIQAAEELPAWVKPETSQNRVFIHQGILHIIPLPTNPAELTMYPIGRPSIRDAYELVIGNNKTNASDKIQALVFERIQGYPEKFKQELHYAHCYIPEEVVYILQQEPSIIANAVQAVYHRDPIDINLCNEMKVFHPESRVLSSVKFTRHLYAQLNQVQLIPNRKSKWKLPSCHDKTYKSAYLGYKLTCGFEMLAARTTSMSNRANVNEFSGRLWEKYLTNLKKRDYFQSELEGSKRYNELLEQAKHHFKNTICSKETNDPVGNRILQFAEDAKEHREVILSACENLKEEDSDDWMTITPEELDKMMLGMWGGSHTENRTDQENVDNLTKLASGVKSFVDQVSSYEGAETIMANEGHDVNNIEFEPKVFRDYALKLLDPSESFSNSADLYDPNSEDSDVEDEFVSCFRDEKTDNEMRLMMENMDLELKQSSLSQSFTPVKDDQCQDDDAPLDIDINMIQNFVESFSNQDGLAGPVSSLLQSIGMSLPPDDGS